MNDAVERMLARYERNRIEDSLRALREILQEIALLGLWRSKFFDKAAFYGGTALRLLYGLDRFSEDLDFSLLTPTPTFELSRYGAALQAELAAFGFGVRFESRAEQSARAVQSAFLKADTLQQLLVIESGGAGIAELPRGQVLKIKLEVDTVPPPGFVTEVRYLLQPVAFPVRVYMLPDLFAGKMHAVLCRKWKNRVKGRDWYDLVWYVAHHPQLHLGHLEQRMRQSGHWQGTAPLTAEALFGLVDQAIDRLNVEQARKEVEVFVRDPGSLAVWSRDFFHDIARRIELT
jgi:hypothetical protein